MVHENKLETICVCGIGGVGGYFGGRLALAMNNGILQDKKIYFIARGKHLEEIKRNGLTLNMAEEKGLTCKPTLATNDLSELPDIDIFMICVKSYDLENILHEISKKVTKNTIIMPLLNGIDICERVRAIIKDGIVLPSTVYLGSFIEKPGMVTQRGGGVMVSGKDPLFLDFEPQDFIKIFTDAGITFKWSDDSYPPIWEKYIFVASLALISALADKTLGEVLDDQELTSTMRQIMEEIVSIGIKKGINLPENIIEKVLESMKTFPHELKTSYQRDVEKKGKNNEGDIFGAAIISQGKKYNVPTPITELVFSRIREKLNVI